MRFGIIGCGSIAESSFGPALLASQRLELAAVCRRDLQAAKDFAARFGCPRAYASAAELVRDDQVQAVIVSTPTDTHRDYTCLAAEHGKHVLCEKPMARNAAECREMMAACRAHGVTLAVAYRRRTCPQVVAAKRLIAAGRIGRVVFARTHYSGRWDPQPGDWRIEPEIGGALMEMASHRIEVLLNFGGRPRSVSAAVGTLDHDWPVDDTDALIVRFEEGGIGMHSTILTSPPRRDFAQIDGDRGRILIDPLELTADHLLLELPEGDRAGSRWSPLQEKLFDLPMVEDFAAAAESGEKPVCDAESGYWVQAVSDAARAASASGTETAVESPGL